SRLPGGIRGELIGVQIGAAQVLVNRAVEAVAARLDGYVDHSAGGAAHLRIVDVGLNTELLRRFRRWNVSEVRTAGIGIVADAVDLILVGARYAAADGEVGNCAVIKGA